MSLLSEFWIITSGGVPVYHKSLVDKLDESLFGGFISAIHVFVKELGEEELKKMEMGGSKIVILSSEDKDWFFIGRSNIKVKEKKIQKYLMEIREIFYKQYGEILTNWNDNIEIFKTLDNYIDLNNPDTPEKKKKAEKVKSRGGFL